MGPNRPASQLAQKIAASGSQKAKRARRTTRSAWISGARRSASSAPTISVSTAARSAGPIAGPAIRAATVAEDDRVAASFVYEGRQEGVYYGFEPTGRRLWFTSCDIFRIADGRIAEHWGMGDIAGIVAQLKG